jgi:transposase-like protein
MARPSSYTDKLADEICERIENGESLIGICKEDGMPDPVTVRRWLRANEEFHTKYARAREESAHASADIVKEYARRVADGDMDANAARVAIDAEKWSAGKRKPKVYGDRQILDVGEDTLAKLSDERVHARIAELAKELGVAALLGGGGKKEAGE